MWSDVGSTNSNNESTKVNYLSLPVGVTKIRIVDDQPVTRWVHWIQAANHGKGMSVACIGKGCPVCKEIKAAKDVKQTPKYSSSKSHAINVIDRTTGNIAILDKGNSVFNPMVSIMEQMPDIKGYDLSIAKKGEKKDSVYTVIPCYPPTPLTTAELELKKYDLVELTKPLTSEQVTRLMNGEDIGEVLKPNIEGTTSASVSGAPPSYVPTGNSSSTYTNGVSVDFTQQTAM